MDRPMNTNHFVGPKEWRPFKWPEPGSSLLSEAENERLYKLAKASKRGLQFPSEDCAWLCELARRLAFLRPDDYDFPEYLAYVNQIAEKAFAMRFVQTVDLTAVVKLSPGKYKDPTVLDHSTDDRASDALVVVRPFVRLHAPCSNEVVEYFRGLSLKLNIDGTPVIHEPLEEHLIGPRGENYRKNLWRVRWLEGHLYPVVLLDDEQKADGRRKVGIGCPHGTRLQLSISRLPEDVEATFTAGFVAARYSTRSAGGIA